MTIRLHWPSQDSKGLTSIEIYRKVGWDATLDTNNPGTPVATLAGDATEYIEKVADLTPKTIYKYWIAAVKGTERLIGAPVMQGFYLDTGPGPQTLKMGDWKAGYFGTVKKEEFFSTPELKLLLPAGRNKFFMNDPAFWHKFVFKGRIIFIPGYQHGSGYAFSDIYTQGMAYGVDGNGTVVPSGQNATKQNATISKDGRTYRIRLPYYVDYDDTEVGSMKYGNGEWMNTYARLFRAAPSDNALGGRGCFANISPYGTSSATNSTGTALLVPLYTVNYAFYAYGNAPWNATWDTQTKPFTYFFVFELILP